MLSVIIIGVGGWVTRVQYFFDVSFVTDCRQLFDVFIISFGCECVYVACVGVCVCFLSHWLSYNLFLLYNMHKCFFLLLESTICNPVFITFGRVYAMVWLF